MRGLAVKDGHRSLGQVSIFQLIFLSNFNLFFCKIFLRAWSERQAGHWTPEPLFILDSGHSAIIIIICNPGLDQYLPEKYNELTKAKKLKTLCLANNDMAKDIFLSWHQMVHVDMELIYFLLPCHT